MMKTLSCLFAALVAGASSAALTDGWPAGDGAFLDDPQKGLAMDFRKDMAEPDDYLRQLSNDVDHVAKVDRCGGISCLTVDGKAVPPVLFKGHAAGGEALPFSGKVLSETGVRILVANVGFRGSPWFPKSPWTQDGFDAKAVVRSTLRPMLTATNALWMLTLRVDPPMDYACWHTNEAWRTADGGYVYGNGVHAHGPKPVLAARDEKVPPVKQTWPWVSMHSRVWREELKRNLSAYIAELKASGLSKRVVGVHFGGFHDAQFATAFPDYSPAAKAAFAASGETDYNRFLKFGPQHLCDELAAHVKGAFGKDIVAFRWCMGAFGDSYCSAHDIGEFLRSKHVDGLVPQAAYELRAPGRPFGPTLPAASFHLHGKLLVHEFDLYPWLIRDPGRSKWFDVMVSRGRNPDEWRTIHRKLAGAMIARRTGWWYFDMGGGWYTPPEIAADIADVQSVLRDGFRPRNLAWHPDAALLIDAADLLAQQDPVACGPRKAKLQKIVEEMARSGVPYDTYLKEDFDRDPALVTRYRAVFTYDRNTPVLSTMDIRRKVGAAGGYMPVPEATVEVDMNGDFLSVHAIWDCKTDFILPFPCRVVNLKSGREEKVVDGRLPLELKRGTTGWFRLEAREGSADDALSEGFANPPRTAKPQTWYHMMNGNVTKEGITRDFEELAAAGVGGVQMFDAGCAIPSGPMRFNSPAWFDLLKHAMSEARRLDLEICMPNCSGWSSSGGPWNPASNAMKKVVFTETRVKGGANLSGPLAEPKNPCGFYRDIAVLAVPVPPANLLSYEGQRQSVGKDEACVTADEPVEACGCSVRIGFRPVWRAVAHLTLEISRDGKTYEPYGTRTLSLTMSGRGTQDYRYIPFAAPMKLRGLRTTVRFENVNSPQHPVSAELRGLRLERRIAVTSLDCKRLEFRGDLEPPSPEGTPEQVVAKEAVLDLTAQAKEGALAWSAPTTASEWAVLRIGYATQPVYNHPASVGGQGFEVDKLSAAAMDYHFEQYIARLCRHLGPLAGGETGLNNILVDSYEVGSQNWTSGFERIFRERRGYDLTRYLPVFAGYVVGNVDETERFLWDFRRVVADLFAENYAGALAKKCHQYGLRLSLEPYGSGPFDNLQYGRYADIPMGEFWSMSKHPGYCAKAGNAKYVSFVGHVWGKPYVATESFTAYPGDSGAWLTTPELIKPIGDAAYADGVNRIIYHRFVHQPWADDRYVPGLTMGQWGMHFDRHNTWWPYAKEFLRYQARCQFMLQQGRHVADVLFWCGEDAPNQGGNTDGGAVSPYSLPYGYDWDVCETEAFRLLKVIDGAVVAPGGTRYRLLVLPTERALSPELLAKVDELVSAGAKVAGPVCPVTTPGLRGGPAANDGFAERAAAVWRKGVLKADAASALKALNLAPDFVFADGPAAPQWDHRRTSEADIYFVCRNNEKKETLTCSFRGMRQPELWDAVTGAKSAPRAWYVAEGRTVVKLDFETCGSVFVVFRDTPSAGLKKAALPTVVSERTVEGPWDVSFAAKYEGAPKARRFDRLVSWTESDDPDLRYLSGSGTYVKKVEIVPPKKGERVVLDLGAVKNFAEVTVNGRTFPPLWKPPYRLDITEALASSTASSSLIPLPSSLSLSLKVTNLWPNRLIGDDALPADVEWKAPDGPYQPIKEIPQWVKDGKKSPTGRHTFTTWRFWKANDPLLPSGLLGPVRLIVEK